MDAQVRESYLDLLEQSLTRSAAVGKARSRHRRRATALLMRLLGKRGFTIVPSLPLTDRVAVTRVNGLPGSRLLTRVLARRGFRVIADDFGRDGFVWNGQQLARIEREFGLDWPARAETMVGRRRLGHVGRCVADVLERDVPGDLLEAGVWRGGTTILMRGVLAAHGDTGRQVWVADSFAGLPKPDAAAFPADAGLDYSDHEQLSVGVQTVRENFARYGLLDDRVRFLVGWFKDTLPSAPVERLAVLRLDGDLYESTMDALQALYPKLSVGGYLIVDDYGALEACRRAVDDYRAAHGIDEPMHPVDWTGVYWRRETG
jgi:O-methyltransferase